ncbi:MAG TPA: hypothetical protein VHG72_00025 [Polyangia bacterium]|nr:hypothetical protein [Polyangia bacterium]
MFAGAGAAVAFLTALSAAEVGTVESHGLQIAPSLDLEGGALAESRAGEQPLIPGQAPQAFVAELVTPLVGIELRRPTLSLDLSYAPRFYFEHPTPAGASTPLILHAAALAFRGLASREVTITGTATGSFGKPDYNALSQALGTAQGQLPPVVEEIGSVNGLVEMDAELAPRWLLLTTGQVFYWKWLNPGPTPPVVMAADGTILPLATSQIAFALAPGVTQHLTERDDLAYVVTAGYADYSSGTKVLTLTPTFGWRTRLTRRDVLKLTLGASYAQALGLTTNAAVRGANVSPVGSALLEGDLARRERTYVTGLVGATVDYYLDPVLQVALPRAAFTLRVAATVVPDWSVGLNGDFATALLRTPLPGNPDETTFTVTLPVRHRISSDLFAELGVRWADRGPSLNAPEFAFHQRQLWLYFSLTATTIETARWGVPPPPNLLGPN